MTPNSASHSFSTGVANLEQAGWEQCDRWMINRVVTEPRMTAEYPDVRAWARRDVKSTLQATRAPRTVSQAS